MKKEREGSYVIGSSGVSEGFEPEGPKESVAVKEAFHVLGSIAGEECNSVGVDKHRWVITQV